MRLPAVAPKPANFGYNADGQVTSLSRYADTSGTNLVAASTYGFDQDNRLTSVLGSYTETGGVQNHARSSNSSCQNPVL